MKASNKVNTSRIAVPEVISSMYHQDIGVHRLEVQLQMLPDLIKAFRSQNLTRLTVTKVCCSSNGQGYVFSDRQASMTISYHTSYNLHCREKLLSPIILSHT